MVSDIFTQDTGNAHGPVTAALPTGLGLRVNVVVLQTSRPPASPLPPATDPFALPQGAAGLVESLLGEGGGRCRKHRRTLEPYRI